MGIVRGAKEELLSTEFMALVLSRRGKEFSAIWIYKVHPGIKQTQESLAMDDSLVFSVRLSLQVALTATGFVVLIGTRVATSWPGKRF